MLNLLVILNLVFLIIIILLLTLKKEDKSEIVLKQDELKERLFEISKELSQSLLNVRNQINQEILNILKNTENLVLNQVNNAINNLGKTDINLQQRMENLRDQVHKTITDTVKNLTTTINSTTSQLNVNLDAKLEQVNKRLADTTGLVSSLNLKIGELSRSAEELRKINEDLKNALVGPKLRGEMGELILENMLKEILPKEIYKLQYPVSSNDFVDAAIFIENRFIPIDAKFPIEAYKRMVNSEDNEYEKNKQSFIRDVKVHIDKITKYIQPEKGSFNFAFMYIPSEPVFYSLLVCEDKDGESIFNYAWSKKRILPVSPQSLFVYFNIILLGLKGKMIEKNAEYILKTVEGMGKLLENLKQSFERSLKQLKYALGNFEEAKDIFDEFENDFKLLQKLKIGDISEKEKLYP